MIIHSIRMQDFLSHEDSEVSFSEHPLWLISGENGAGKSAFFDALEYALYGEHRAQKQQAKLLIRSGSGSGRARITIWFALDGETYQLTHTIGPKGNEGERLQRQVEGVWQEVNVGPNRRDTWGYLRTRLPAHELLRSAIFLLRKGDADHFFDVSSEVRVRRFAALIDLARYTRLSQRAKARADLAERRGLDAEAERRALGDTSDAALATAQAAVDERKLACDSAQQAVAAAAGVVAGARAWDQLRSAERQQVALREHVRQLLHGAEAIRTAEARVSRWERAVASIDGHRTASRHARDARTEASTARTQADAARKQADEHTEALALQQKRQQQLVTTELPAARTSEAQHQQRQQALTLERDIAEARVRHEAAQAELTPLLGADGALKTWQQAQAGLPHLETLVKAGAELLAAQMQAGACSLAVDAAEAAEREGGAAKTAAAATEQRSREVFDELVDRVRELERRADVLQGRIDQHDQLAGDEDTCPFCAQELDAEAHAHAQRVLSVERDRLEAVRTELEAAGLERQQAEARYKRDLQASKSATDAHAKAITALALASQELRQAHEAVQRTQAVLVTARKTAQQQTTYSVQQLDALTEASLADEQARVLKELGAAQAQDRKLQTANLAAERTQATLDAHRSRRAVDAQPLGDTETVMALTAGEASAAGALSNARTARQHLESEERECQQAIIKLTAKQSTAVAAAASESGRADRADASADRFSVEAAKLAEMLGPAWADVLATDADYQTERTAVEAARPLAERHEELAQVRATQDEIDWTEQQHKEQTARLDPTHELPISAAEVAHTEAQAAERQHVEQLGAARNSLAQLTCRRKTATELGQVIDEATQVKDTYRTLEELLKDGGPIQVTLAGQEQRRIVEQMNDVLERLGDTLRAQLGTARRAGNSGIEDIHIIETSNPHSAAHFFEYLSGGEQFRVALALALALHRRVGRQAGTLIVDEGFGALDSRRRYDLAARLTDTTDTLLNQGLAHSIVICSHSEEVQQQFPNRWHVRKQGGAASVTRAAVDD